MSLTLAMCLTLTSFGKSKISVGKRDGMSYTEPRNLKNCVSVYYYSMLHLLHMNLSGQLCRQEQNKCK